MMRRPHRPAARGGFTIVEIIVSLVLMGIIVTSIAAANVAVLRRGASVSRASLAAGTAVEQANRLGVLPYDSLGSRAGCTTIVDATFPHTRCITVATSGQTKTVRIVITPASPLFAPDTVLMWRTKPVTTTPFDQ